jgi:SAM-dependent methyltransferase
MSTAHTAQTWHAHYESGRDSRPLSEAEKAILAEHLALPEGSERARALEVACGTGQLARFLAAAGYRVDAVDWAEAALQRATATSHGITYHRLDVTAGDLVSLEPVGRGYRVITVRRAPNTSRPCSAIRKRCSPAQIQRRPAASLDPAARQSRVAAYSGPEPFGTAGRVMGPPARPSTAPGILRRPAAVARSVAVYSGSDLLLVGDHASHPFKGYPTRPVHLRNRHACLARKDGEDIADLYARLPRDDTGDISVVVVGHTDGNNVRRTVRA